MDGCRLGCRQCWVFRWGVWPQVECSGHSCQSDGSLQAVVVGQVGGCRWNAGRVGGLYGCKQGAADSHGSPWAGQQAVCQSGAGAGGEARQPWQLHDTLANWGRAALNMLACSLWALKSHQLMQL